MSDGIEIKFNTRFRQIPDLPENGDKVSISGCGIDINGIVKNVEMVGHEYIFVIEPIYDMENEACQP